MAIDLLQAMKTLGRIQDSLNKRDYKSANRIAAELNVKVLKAAVNQRTDRVLLRDLAEVVLAVDDMAPIRN